MALPKKRTAAAAETTQTAPAEEVVTHEPAGQAEAVPAADVSEEEMTPWENQANEVAVEAPETNDTVAPTAQQETASTTLTAPQQPNLPAVAGRTVMVSEQEATDAGFAGMDMDWTSFPTIKLDKGTYKSSDGHNLGSGLQVRILQSRVTFIVKNGASNQDEEEFVYTTPNDDKTFASCTHTNSGEPLEAVFAKWRMKGYDSPTHREYRNAVAEVVDGDMAGEIAMLSIPQTSIGRFGALRIKLLRAGYSGIADLPNAVVQLGVGPTIGSGRTAFQPWTFDVLPKE